jgi:hypothetical protein
MKQVKSFLLLIRSLVRRHHYNFLSLRLVRNPSGYSERFPTSGNDMPLLTNSLVTLNKEGSMFSFSIDLLPLG